MLLNALSAIDLYGHNVSLTYNNKSRFNTAFGGIITLGGFGFMAVYLYLVYLRVSGHEYSLTENMEYRNPVLYPERFPIQSDDDFILST